MPFIHHNQTEVDITRIRAAILVVITMWGPIAHSADKTDFTEAVKSISPVLDAVWPENSSSQLLVIVGSRASKQETLDVVQLVCQTASEFQRPSFDVHLYRKYPTKKMIRDRCIASR